MKSLMFELKAWIGNKLTESFYAKMGKRLNVSLNRYQGSVDIEWAYIGNHTRQTVLYLHGFSDRKENFYFASKRLSKQYDIIIPDLPGFGRSTIDENLVYSQDNYVKWMGEFIEKNDFQNFHIAGCSLGGLICARLASKYPDRIKSLSLVDPAGFYIPGEKSIYDEILQGINLFHIETPEEFDLFQKRIFYKVPHLPGFVREYMIQKAIRNQKWYGKIFHEIVNLDYVLKQNRTLEEMSLNSICREIKSPTKIFWGKHDSLFPSKTADYLHREIKGSEICVFENLGHCPCIENPNRFSGELLRFLDGLK